MLLHRLVLQASQPLGLSLFLTPGLVSLLKLESHLLLEVRHHLLELVDLRQHALDACETGLKVLDLRCPPGHPPLLFLQSLFELRDGGLVLAPFFIKPLQGLQGL